MRLYLVRHGIADERPPDGAGGDAKRPLSARGVARTRAAARGFAVCCGPVDRIVASPLVRAGQTARIMARTLRLRAGVETAAELLPEADPAATLAWLGTRREEALMLVGHMPHLEALAALLLAGRIGARLRFRKAGVCALETAAGAAAGSATLVAFLPAGVLRAVR
jgi:phosphohistidine phosphatase